LAPLLVARVPKGEGCDPSEPTVVKTPCDARRS
jgi:hypothetical protein